MPAPTNLRLLRFAGHASFRYRLVLSLLARKPVRIDDIRSEDTEPGLRDYEVSFLRLLEKITNGTEVEISYTGASILFSPGTLTGGPGINHTCPNSRSIGWFLEPLLALAPFCKRDLDLVLRGVTTDDWAPSADILRTSFLPHLAMFLESPESLELRILKRGHPPHGGGELHFHCPAVRQLKSGFQFVDPGKVLKIRGIAHSVRVSPQFANRLVSSARSVLNRYIPDVYIYTDIYKGEDSGKSPGYALSLLATSTTSAHYSSEAASTSPKDQHDDQQQTPEDIGVAAARALLSTIARRGCIDAGIEWMVCLMMVLGGDRDVARVRLGSPMTPFLIQFLRDLREFFGTSFKIKAATGDVPEYTLSCVGMGFQNVNKKAF